MFPRLMAWDMTLVCELSPASMPCARTADALIAKARAMPMIVFLLPTDFTSLKSDEETSAKACAFVLSPLDSAD